MEEVSQKISIEIGNKQILDLKTSITEKEGEITECKLLR